MFGSQAGVNAAVFLLAASYQKAQFIFDFNFLKPFQWSRGSFSRRRQAKGEPLSFVALAPSIVQLFPKVESTINSEVFHAHNVNLTPVSPRNSLGIVEVNGGGLLIQASVFFPGGEKCFWTLEEPKKSANNTNSSFQVFSFFLTR